MPWGQSPCPIVLGKGEGAPHTLFVSSRQAPCSLLLEAP